MAYPSYLALAESGELDRRAEALEALAQPCRLCPRRCLAGRGEGARGACGAGTWASLVSWGPHPGEEPCLSGQRGSGTLFLGHCNLRCLFCQNSDISQDHEFARRREVEDEEVAEAMLHLQVLGCHNINWVSPTHTLPALVRALALAARRGLRLPIVYNTGGYDSGEALALLDGIVDIYMPDLKYAEDRVAEELSGVPHYVESARAAIREMHRQVGDLRVDDDGIARRGLLIRHLVLPHGLSGTEATLRWIAQTLGEDTVVNVMAQYHPAHRAHTHPLLARPLSHREYGAAVECAQRLGLRRAMVQNRPL